MQKFHVSLLRFENDNRKKTARPAVTKQALMEFHILKNVREKYGIEGSLFSLTGNVILADMRQVRGLTQQLNTGVDPAKNPERYIQVN